MQQDTILVVDDAEVNRTLLGEMFKNQYRILEAADGEEAIEIIKKEAQSLAIILLDIIMPNVDGYGVLEFLSQYSYMESIPVIIISGDSVATQEMKGYEYGVSDILSKPFNPQIVIKRVNNIIDLFAHKKNLEQIVQEQVEEIEYQIQRTRDTTSQIIETLSSIIEFRDIDTGEHVSRVKAFTEILLKKVKENYPEYGFNDWQINLITNASVIHDIGKIAIPDSILLKPEKLTEEEINIVRTHTIKGCEIIKKLEYIDDKEFLDYCYEITSDHHERYDGTGYPSGKKGDDIPISAQVVGLANEYDHLVSKRAYKDASTKEEAYKIIMEDKGAFSDKLLHCFELSRAELERVLDKK